MVFTGKMTQGSQASQITIVAVIPLLFYHGKSPWKWPVSFQKGFFGKFLNEIPLVFRENMLDFKMKVLDTNDPKIKKAFKDPRIKSRGILALLARIWFVKNSVSELLNLTTAFSNFAGKRLNTRGVSDLLAVCRFNKSNGIFS